MEASYRKMNVIGNSRLGVYDGKIAGLYDLEETLGSGHFAVVKLARHVFTGEKVAVKVIDKTKLDEVSKAHLFQEVRCMKLVQHPNVVRLYEVIDTQTKLYLILELGDGGDLYDYIMKHDGGLTENMARNYFKQIVRAISYCHQLHVVHRDLKPENVVFFEKLGVVKLTDFGFSNKFCPGQKLETSCGSLAYSAPEILLGDSYDAPAVDVWSLGVILYMLVCGHPPFQEANDSETLTMIMDCKYTMPPHISIECRTLIAKMLIREPDKRATLQQIAQDIWLTQSSNSSGNGTGSDNTDGNVTTDDAPLPDYLPLVSREQVSDEDHTLIINKMVNGGVFTKEEILDALDKNEYNHITATYFLIAERKLRASRQDQLALKKRPELTTSLHVTNPNRPKLQESIKDEEFLHQNININSHLLLMPSSSLSSSSSNNTSLLSVPRIPAIEGSQTGRMRKCSIVQEEEDDEEDAATDELTLNRRGSRSEGRLNITLQDRLAENERIKNELAPSTVATALAQPSPPIIPDTAITVGPSATRHVTDSAFEHNTQYTISSFIAKQSMIKPGLIQTAAATATATAAAAIQSKGLFDGLSGVTKITQDDNNARDRLGTARQMAHGGTTTTVNRKKNDLRSRTTAATDAIGTNKLLTECKSKLTSNEQNRNIRSNSVDHGCSSSRPPASVSSPSSSISSNYKKLPNKDIIETKFLTDSSTISIPLNQSNSYITQTTIPKYKTMPSPTRSNTILPGTSNCLNEIFEESTDTGSTTTPIATPNPTPTASNRRRAIQSTASIDNDKQIPEHHPHFYHHNPATHNTPNNQSALATTYHHRRNKCYKTKTTSCSSSDASDDDSENRKKRATKIVVDSTKPIQYSQRRDSHDDSSDSQEPSGNNNKSTSTGASASIEMFVNSRNNQQQQQQHDNTRQRNGGNNNNNKSTTLQISAKSNSTQSTHSIGFRRHRGRRRNGETRLRESQSLNRITEVQESEIPSAIQYINNVQLQSTTTNTTSSSIAIRPPSSSSSSTSSSSSSSSSLPTPSLSIVTNYDGISESVCCQTMATTTTTTTGGNQINSIKPKSFGARLFQGFSSRRMMETNNDKKTHNIYSITTNCNVIRGGTIAIGGPNAHRPIATDPQLFTTKNQNQHETSLVDEDVEIVLGVEIAKALKVSDSKSSTATKKLKLLGRYFQEQIHLHSHLLAAY